MSVQIVLDLTADFNVEAISQIDIGGFDYAVAQIVNPTNVVLFSNTNDSGAIQGVSDGSAVSATNFEDVQGVNLASGTAVTSIAASGLVRFQSVGQYLKFSSTSSSTKVDKLLVRLYKIH